MRHGQVTVFIIIGLLVVIVIVGMLMLTSRVALQRGAASAERQQIRAELIKPVQQFITNCLEQALSRGIELIGLQGGYIYASEDGPTPDPVQPGVSFEREDTKVRYLVFPPVGTVGTAYYSEPPDYPWPTFPIVYNATGGVRFPQFFFGYFGRNLLPALERGNPNSIQDQLESFIVAKMRQCRLDAFESQGLSFEAGDPNVATLLATADTAVVLNWPLTVRDKATGAITDLDRFAAYVPVRLNTTYALIRSLLDREVTEINFTLPGLYADGFGVDLLRDIDGTGEDLVLARDTRSRIRGSPFLFQFGRHNRPPALFFITPAWAGLLANTTVCAGTSLTLVPLPPGTAGPSLPGNPFPTPTSRASLTITSPASIDAPCAGRNETFTLAIPLESIDPDEDNITFSCDPECPRTIDAAEADQFISYFDGNWSFQVRAFDSAVADTQRLELRLGT